MKITLPSLLASCFVASTALAAPSTPAAAPAPAPHAVYRMDFELTTSEPGKPAATTTFSINLDERHSGSAMIGDNVPLGGAAGTSMRQNVGVHVVASFEPYGSDLLLDADTELSALGTGGTVHKIEAKDVAVATPGRKTLVASIDHNGLRTQLSVTPTKL